MRLICKSTCIISFIALFWAGMGWSLPKYQRTTLPFPDQMDASDLFMAREVLKLSVYQDHEDPNHYYYVPPFNIRRYVEGTTTMMLHGHNVREYAAGIKLLHNRDNFRRDKIDEKKSEIRHKENAKLDWELKLFDALSQSNEKAISYIEGKIAKLEQEIAEEKNILKEIIESALKNADQMASFHFSQSGFNIDLSDINDSEKRIEQLKVVAQKAAASYGGYLSANIYAGFTHAQIEALSAYKAKYMPQIKVSLLPIEKLNFFPLTEWQNDPHDGATASKIFRSVQGSGDYLGAALVMNNTIAGALGLAEHLQPFILPVGISATFKQMIEPTEAELTCDFSTGYEVKGRADVRDGLVIYDNDITNTIKASDRSYGACNLTHIHGDLNSAQYKALQEMEKEFENMRIFRTSLARSEKEAYYRSVLADINDNRRKEEPAKSNIFHKFAQWGWLGVALEGLSRAAEFHWHTNIQDISNISEIKFTKRILIKGHESVEAAMPTNLCFVFNQMMGRYDRCTTIEEYDALNMRESMATAASTPSCQGISDPFECGRNRDAEGLTERRGDRTIANDTLLMNTLR